MPNQLAGVNVVTALRESGYTGFIGVTTAHEEDNQEFIDAGVDATYSIYEGAAETFSEIVSSDMPTMSYHAKDLTARFQQAEAK